MNIKKRGEKVKKVCVVNLVLLFDMFSSTSHQTFSLVLFGPVSLSEFFFINKSCRRYHQ